MEEDDIKNFVNDNCILSYDDSFTLLSYFDYDFAKERLITEVENEDDLEETIDLIEDIVFFVRNATKDSKEDV